MTNEEIARMEDRMERERAKAAQERARAKLERTFKGDFVPDTKIVDNAEVATLNTIAWAINEAGRRAHDNAVAKGFYEDPPRDLERIALIHSEISEAAENAWQAEMTAKAINRDKFFSDCTPGYYNGEGKPEGGAFFNGIYGGGPFGYMAILKEWRAKDGLSRDEVALYE